MVQKGAPMTSNVSVTTWHTSKNRARRPEWNQARNL